MDRRRQALHLVSRGAPRMPHLAVGSLIQVLSITGKPKRSPSPIVSPTLACIHSAGYHDTPLAVHPISGVPLPPCSRAPYTRCLGSAPQSHTEARRRAERTWSISRTFRP